MEQAKAVLLFLQCNDGIKPSWCDKQKKYLANPKIARWENGREQGYIISLRSLLCPRQLNIAFFEHRNSDSIEAIKWEQYSDTPITIDTAIFGDVYKNKYDTSFSVNWGDVLGMSQWITNELEEFWEDSNNIVEYRNATIDSLI